MLKDEQKDGISVALSYNCMALCRKESRYTRLNKLNRHSYIGNIFLGMEHIQLYDTAAQRKQMRVDTDIAEVY